MSNSSHFRSACRLFTMYSHKRKSSRDPISVQEAHSASERIRTEQQDVGDHLKLRADEAAEGENAASSELSEAEYHTRFLFLRAK